MEQTQFYELLAQANAIYSNFIPKDKSKKTLMVNAWWKVLKNCDYKKCCDRLISFSRENEFPPKPKDIYLEPKNQDTQLQKNINMFEAWSRTAGDIKDFQKNIPVQFRSIQFSEESKQERIAELKRQAERLIK